MLARVPDAEFEPVEIWLRDQRHYLVIRDPDGEQTTAQTAAQQACSLCP